MFVRLVDREAYYFTGVTFTPYDGDIAEDYYIRGGERHLNRIVIELCEDGVMRDRAYVRPGEGKNCTKFSINKNTPKIFIPKNNKDYAIACTEGAKVMPLCFTTNKSGTYTLRFDTKDMPGDYLHLIDNATGIDIDLMAATSTPSTGSGNEGSVASYTFDSKDCNYATRFRLVLDEEATNEIPESFAYVSNGQLMINGTGTLQVMDILGRPILTKEISTLNSQLITSPQVYMWFASATATMLKRRRLWLIKTRDYETRDCGTGP